MTVLEAPAQAARVSFGEMTPPGNPRQFVVDDEYAPQNLDLGGEWYRYVDVRDPSDTVGISLGEPSQLNQFLSRNITFLKPVTNLQVEWFTLVGDISFSAFDGAGSLLSSISNLSGGNTTSFLAGSSISRLNVRGLSGYAAVTTLSFDQVLPPPPEPGPDGNPNPGPNPGPTPVPTPALIPSLVAMGVAALRKQRQDANVEE